MDELREIYIKNSRLPLRLREGNLDLKPSTTNDLNSFKRLKAIKDNIKLFVDKHQSLLISSDNVGNGKTTWSAKIIKAYIDDYAKNYSFANNTPVLFINIPQFLMNKKLAINNPEIAAEIEEIEKCIFSSDIVVFDDIATKTASDYDKELLYVYVNYRTDNFLTNIYTTNVSKNDLEKELGERLADRIVGYSVCIELDGASRRESK